MAPYGKAVEIIMRKFVAGVMMGLILGGTTVSWAAGIFGSGSLSGWSVMKDGEEICTDPDVDTLSKEIDCD